MCLGTECPIIAMELLQKRKNYMFRAMIYLTRLVLAKHGKTPQHKHLFCAEIVPFKQAYVQINWPDVTVSRDVVKLAGAVNPKSKIIEQKSQQKRTSRG